MVPKIQVVFQGGGARFAALLAAADALQTLEEEHLVEVTRVAGASAGSIIAAIYGKRISIFKTIRPFLIDKVKENYFTRLFPRRSIFRHLFRIASGRALYDITALRPLLEQFIPPGDLLKQQAIPTLITATNHA